MAHDLFSFDPSVLLVRDTAGDYRPAQADEVLRAAQRILRQQLGERMALCSPQAVRAFLKVKLGALEHEVFAVLMLDSQNRLIEYVELFRGTVSQTSVYPREVVKECLARNAATLVLVHSVARHRMHLLCLESLCSVQSESPALQRMTLNSGHIRMHHRGLSDRWHQCRRMIALVGTYGPAWMSPQ